MITHIKQVAHFYITYSDCKILYRIQQKYCDNALGYIKNDQIRRKTQSDLGKGNCCTPFDGSGTPTLSPLHKVDTEVVQSRFNGDK